MARQAAVTGVHMSFEAFRGLPEQPGLQLIDGMVVKEPSPTYRHQSSLLSLSAALLRHVKVRDLGRVIVAPFDVILGEQVLQPDVMFVQADRVGLIRDDGLYGAPDLVVEVLSASTRRYDLGRKRELYFDNGCLEMWFVDLEFRTVQQLTRRGAAPHSLILTGDDTLESALLPGFSLPVGEVFDN